MHKTARKCTLLAVLNSSHFDMYILGTDFHLLNVADFKIHLLPNKCNIQTLIIRMCKQQNDAGENLLTFTALSFPVPSPF
jgi:hypothetical protein